MSSQTSLVAEQVRLQQWAAQIQDCKYTVIHPYYSNFKPPFPAARF